MMIQKKYMQMKKNHLKKNNRKNNPERQNALGDIKRHASSEQRAEELQRNIALQKAAAKDAENVMHHMDEEALKEEEILACLTYDIDETLEAELAAEMADFDEEWDDEFDEDDGEDYWLDGAFFVKADNLPEGRDARFLALCPPELYPPDLYADHKPRRVANGCAETTVGAAGSQMGEAVGEERTETTMSHYPGRDVIVEGVVESASSGAGECKCVGMGEMAGDSSVREALGDDGAEVAGATSGFDIWDLQDRAERFRMMTSMYPSDLYSDDEELSCRMYDGEGIQCKALAMHLQEMSCGTACPSGHKPRRVANGCTKMAGNMALECKCIGIDEIACAGSSCAESLGEGCTEVAGVGSSCTDALVPLKNVTEASETYLEENDQTASAVNTGVAQPLSYNEFHLKSLDETGVIEGYASVFDVTDAHGDVMKRGAFARSLQQMQNGTMPKMLWQHQPENPIGVWEYMEEDEYGLRIKGRLLMNLTKAQEAYTLLKNQVLKGLSIGYVARDFERKNGFRNLLDVDLIEVSLVTFPACPQAQLTNVKMQKIITKEENMIESAKIPGVLQQHYSNEIDDFVQYLRYGQQKSLRQNERGGIQVPDGLIHTISSALAASAPMRRLSSSLSIHACSVELLVNNKENISAGWMHGSASAPDEKAYLERKKIEVHDIYARPRISQNLLDDSVLDLEDWFTEQIAAQIATVENEAFLFGNGQDKPIGIFHDVKQYKAYNVEKLCVDEKSSEHILDTLIDMSHNLSCRYINNAKWLMSPAVFAELRKLKDRAGRHILQTGSSSKNILFGYEVVLDETLTVPNASKVLIAFGNFAACYQIVDRQEMSILRDPYTYKPFVEFFCNKRVGGDVVDPKAINVLFGALK